MRVHSRARLAMASFGRSFYFSFLYVVGIIVLSFLTALLLNRRLFWRTASRTMIYMPYVANVVAIGIVWAIVLNPFGGPINTLLKLLGVPDPSKHGRVCLPLRRQCVHVQVA